MSLLDDLQNNIVILTREFSDGSVVKYKTTQRPDILKAMNLDEDCLYDLDTRQVIPEVVLENVAHYEIKDTIQYTNPLDSLFEKGAKIVW